MQKEVTTTEQMQSLLKDLQQIQMEILSKLKKDMVFNVTTENFTGDQCVECSLSVYNSDLRARLSLYPFFSYDENLKKLAKFKGAVKDFIE